MISPLTNKIIVIIGPTATNKTKVGITLAKMFHGEIINADAFQVYQELNVGVNKPTTAELKQVKFHLINFISIKDK
jgi:tRNA dimethylallyltransferase